MVELTQDEPGEIPYKAESSISIMMLLLQTKASSLVYYGDELGVFNIGLNFLDDFKDATLEQRKRRFEKKGLRVSDFMSAQVLQNKINAQSLMPWSSEKNSGFSAINETIIPANEGFKLTNIADQWVSNGSPLNSFKKLAKMSFGKASRDYFDASSEYYDIKVSMFGVITIMTRSEVGTERQTIINLTNTDKNVRNSEVGRVSIQSFDSKKYPVPPRTFRPYESILTRINADIVNATREIETRITKEVDEYRKVLSSEISDQEKETIAEIDEQVKEITKEIKKFEQKESDVQSKIDATNEIIIRGKSKLLDESSYERIAKELVDDNTAETEIAKKKDEIKAVDQKTQEIKVAIEEKRSKLEELGAKLRAEKEARINAIESNKSETMAKDEITKLREEDLAFTTDIDSDDPNLEDIL